MRKPKRYAKKGDTVIRLRPAGPHVTGVVEQFYWYDSPLGTSNRHEWRYVVRWDNEFDGRSHITDRDFKEGAVVPGQSFVSKSLAA